MQQGEKTKILYRDMRRMHEKLYWQKWKNIFFILECNFEVDRKVFTAFINFTFREKRWIGGHSSEKKILLKESQRELKLYPSMKVICCLMFFKVYSEECVEWPVMDAKVLHKTHSCETLEWCDICVFPEIRAVNVDMICKVLFHC